MRRNVQPICPPRNSMANHALRKLELYMTSMRYTVWMLDDDGGVARRLDLAKPRLKGRKWRSALNVETILSNGTSPVPERNERNPARRRERNKNKTGRGSKEDRPPSSATQPPSELTDGH